MTFLKRLERGVTAVFKLGRTEWAAKSAQRGVVDLRADLTALCHDHAAARADLDHLRHDIAQLQHSITALIETRLDPEQVRLTETRNGLNAQSARVAESLAQHQGRFAALHYAMSDLSRRMDGQGPPQIAPHTAVDGQPGFQAFKDHFYNALEARYRGSEAEIARRLKVYLPEVEAAVMRTGSLPVLDLGCGRGEWLSLLEARALSAWGVDRNPVQIEGAREAGLDVRAGDAVSALTDCADNSLAVITAFHLIEHLPFDTVAWITREALRVLAPGGLLIFETPNTRNVLVGATTFHTDPTHLKPMPEQVTGVLLETAGFHPVICRGLNAHERFGEFLDKPDMNDELVHLLFGPQDLTILGTKPGGEV